METQSAADVVNEEVFKDIMSFIVENYTATTEELVEAYLAITVIQAILKKELGVADMEVILGGDE